MGINLSSHPLGPSDSVRPHWLTWGHRLFVSVWGALPYLLDRPPQPHVLLGSSPRPSTWSSLNAFPSIRPGIGVEEGTSSAGVLRHWPWLRCSRSQGRGGVRGPAGCKLSSRNHSGQGCGEGAGEPELDQGVHGGGVSGHPVAQLEIWSGWTPVSPHMQTVSEPCPLDPQNIPERDLFLGHSASPNPQNTSEASQLLFLSCRQPGSSRQHLSPGSWQWLQPHP